MEELKPRTDYVLKLEILTDSVDSQFKNIILTAKRAGYTGHLLQHIESLQFSVSAELKELIKDVENKINAKQ